MKKILVPTDFSPNANNAFKYALKTAKDFGAEIILLNAYSIPYSGSTVMIDISDVLKEEAWKELEQQMILSNRQYPDVKVTPVAEYGATQDIISNMVDDFNIDLIIMGTKGASGIKGKIFGSITSAVVKKTPCPLIAVPQDFEYTPPKNIAFATDFKKNKKEDFNKVLIEVIDQYKSMVELIYVDDDLSSIDRDKMVEEFEENYPNICRTNHNYHFIQDDDIEDSIVNHLVNNPADLIVVVAKHHGFFERLVHKSISKNIAQHSELPVLILHD